MVPRHASGDTSGQSLILLRARRTERSILLIPRKGRDGKTSTTPEGHRQTPDSTMEGNRGLIATVLPEVLPEYLDGVPLKRDGIESETSLRSQVTRTQF